MSQALAALREDSNLVKKISFETERRPPLKILSHTEFSALFTRVRLSDPIRDFYNTMNDELFLTTEIYEDDYGKLHWGITLNNTQGYSLGNRFFGYLRGHLPNYSDCSNYSKRILKRWHQDAIDQHSGAIVKIENRYWNGESIPRAFFDNLE